VNVRVIPVTPTHETLDFTAIAVTGLLTAGETALSQGPLDLDRFSSLLVLVLQTADLSIFAT